MVYTRGNIVKYIDLKIYNRWGELVYSSNDINKGWDGTYNGVQVNNGLYTYMLKLVFNDKEVKTDKGSITLIK
jgi:gliding motility-associated-like protein